jgi:hypothetical protein
MQLRLTHRALEAEQEAIIEVPRIVDPILVEDEGVTERADLEEAMPVGGVPREPGHLEAHHDARAPEADVRHELLEAVPARH